jgi:hypothetical protein
MIVHVHGGWWVIEPWLRLRADRDRPRSWVIEPWIIVEDISFDNSLTK